MTNGKLQATDKTNPTFMMSDAKEGVKLTRIFPKNGIIKLMFCQRLKLGTHRKTFDREMQCIQKIQLKYILRCKL